DKDFVNPEKIIIPVFSIGDVFLLFYAKRILKNSDCKLALVDHNGIINSNSEIKEEITNIGNYSANSITLMSKKEMDLTALSPSSLLITSFEGWKTMEKEYDLADQLPASLLLIRP
ncbi:MAG: hypothetical protein ACXVPY_11215, partial [Bacteroidia bacterium]